MLETTASSSLTPLPIDPSTRTWFPSHPIPKYVRIFRLKSNESLLLDATLGTWVPSSSSPSPLQQLVSELNLTWTPEPTFLEQLLPMAVERGRRTYSHCPDCLYLRGNGDWSGRGRGGEQDRDGMSPLCSCGAGKVGRVWDGRVLENRSIGHIERLVGFGFCLLAWKGEF